MIVLYFKRERGMLNVFYVASGIVTIFHSANNIWEDKIEETITTFYFDCNKSLRTNFFCRITNLVHFEFINMFLFIHSTIVISAFSIYKYMFTQISFCAECTNCVPVRHASIYTFKMKINDTYLIGDEFS